MGDALVKGLLLGLSTGGFCLGSCAPVMLPYLVSREWDGSRPLLRRAGEFLVGRLFAYVMFALVAIWLGGSVQKSPAVARVAAVGMAVLAVGLILHGLSLSFPEWKTCRTVERWGVLRRLPFLAGVALGISICPPLLLALTYLLTVGQWGAGIGFAVAFFVGTTVYLAPLFLTGLLSRVAALRGAAEVAAVFSGVWFLLQAGALWVKR